MDRPLGEVIAIRLVISRESHAATCHASMTDTDTRLYRKGNTGAQLSYQGLVLMEQRNGDVRVSHADGHGERIMAGMR